MNTRNSVKLLRRVGIALVAMPEVVTTPIGIACIIAARYLSKKLEADLYKSLQLTLKNYLAISARRTKDPESKSDDKKRAKRPVQNSDRIILKQSGDKPVARKVKAKETPQSRALAIPAEPKAKAESAPTTIQSQRHPEVKPVHHEVDEKWLSRRYALADSQKADAAIDKETQDSDKELVRHNIDKKRIAQRFGIETNPKAASKEPAPEETANLIKHDIDRQKIARRFGNTATPKAAAAKKVDSDETSGLIQHNIDRQKIAGRLGNSKLETDPKQENAPEETANMIQHNIDRQNLDRRFGLENKPPANSVSTESKTKKAVRRQSKARALPEKTEISEEKPKAQHHKVDAASLRRRYGITAPR